MCCAIRETECLEVKKLISNFELFLEDFDIELVAVNQIYQNRKEKIIMESTEDMLAEFYLANLAEETMKGLMISAKQCLHNGGKPPIGYDVGKDKKYVINEMEANIVRELFEEYASGKSMDALLKHCQQKGYLTKWGKPFGKNSFNSILKNEKYRGVYVWNRRESRNSHGQCNHHKNKSDDQIIRIEGGIPRIVSDELFFKVQERMKKNKEKAGSFTAKREYLFSSKIFCGKCGHAYTGNTRISGKGIPYTGYRCGERCRTNACNNKEIERTHLEKYVLEKLKDHLFTKDSMIQIAKQLNVFQKSKQKDCESGLKQAKQRLSNVERKINNVTNAIMQGMFNESMQTKMTELEECRTAILEEIRELESSPEVIPEITPEQIKETLTNFEDFMLNHTETAEVKAFIEQYIQKITVYPDYVEVAFMVTFPTVQKIFPVLNITVIATRGEIMERNRRIESFLNVANTHHLKRISTKIVLQERLY